MSRFSIILLFIGFAWSPLNVMAQPDNDVRKMSIEELLRSKITSASKVSESAAESPTMVHIITAADIEDKGYQTLADVLEDIPEIEIQFNVDDEQNSLFSMRGVPGNEHFMVLLNGARINSGASSYHAIDKNYNIRNAQKIEVVMGPVSSVYFANTFFVVNIITLEDDTPAGVSLLGSGGMYNATENAANFTLRNGDLLVQFAGHYFQSASPKLYEHYQDDFSWYNNQYSQNGNMLIDPYDENSDTINTGSPKEWNRDQRAWSAQLHLKYRNFTGGWYHNDNAFSSATGTRPEYMVSAKDYRIGVSVNTYYMKYNYTSLNKKLSIDANGNGVHYRLKPSSSYYDVYGGYIQNFKYGYNLTINFSVTANYNFNDRNRLSIGVATRESSILPTSADLPFQINPREPLINQDVYYIGTNVQDSAGRDLSIPVDFYHFLLQDYGAMLQYQTNIKDAIYLTLGSSINYNTKYGISVNPRFGVVFKPVDNFRVRLQYAEAFMPPSPERVFQQFGSFRPVTDSVSGAVVGLTDYAGLTLPVNGTINAEKIRSAELNFSYLKGNFSLNAGGYFNALENLPQYAETQSDTFHGIAVSNVSRVTSQGSAQTYGGSLGLDYKINFGKRSSIRLNASYAYSDGKVNDLKLYHSSQHTARFGLVLRLGDFTFSPKMMYRSGSWTPIEDIASQVKTPGFILVNLYAKYRVLKPNTSPDSHPFTLDFFVNVRNLSNQKYYNSGNGLAYSFAAVPQDPIRVSGGIIFGIGEKRKIKKQF